MPPPATSPLGFVTAQFLVSLAVVLVVFHLMLGLAGFCTYMERKVSAYIQDRIGPNRTGFDFGFPALKFLRGMFGLGQPLADGLKFILKEDYTPPRVDKFLFSLGPVSIIAPALIGFAIIPWGGSLDVHAFTILGFTIEGARVQVAGASINVGIIYLLAVASLSVYGITLGGWASNNKYSLLGGLRCSAQMISYEIPMGLAILTVLLMTGSLLPEKIIAHQVSHGWLLLSQPLAAAVFFICALAESNRLPFDNAEAEPELVGGYHTEYTSMRLGLFLLSEYIHMVTAAAFFALLFLGGYHLPLGLVGGEGHLLTPENTTILAVLAKFAVYLTKVMLLIFLFMLIRWSLPRLRFDQVMQVAWQGVIPISMVIVVMTSVMVHLGLGAAGPMLLANAALAAAILALLPLMPRAVNNRRVRLSGSRFFAPAGETIQTRPTEAIALEDRPVEGSVPAQV